MAQADAHRGRVGKERTGQAFGGLRAVDNVSFSVERIRSNVRGTRARWLEMARNNAALGLQMRASVDPATLAIRIENKAGQLIVSDAARPLERSGNEFTLRKQLALGEHIFGMEIGRAHV